MTLILETTLPAVREYAKRQAVAHFEKGQFLDSPNEEVQKWLDTRDISPEVGEFDQIYDAYCEGFRSFHVERWIAGLTLDQMAELRRHLIQSDPVASSLPVSSPPAASGVIAAPSVPEVVKIAVEALEMALRYWNDYAEVDEGEDLWISLHREADDFRSAQYALSALRLLTFEDDGDSPEGIRAPASGLDSSSADVPPLGEIEHPHYAGGEQILFDDEFGNGGLLAGGTENIYVDRSGGPPPQFNRQQVHSLIAHLQAWLMTGSFALPSAHDVAKVRPVDEGTASKEPSSEDKELLTEARDALQGIFELHGHLYSSERYVDKWGMARTKCYQTVTKLNAALEASTTSQKGGQGA